VVAKINRWLATAAALEFDCWKLEKRYNRAYKAT